MQPSKVIQRSPVVFALALLAAVAMLSIDPSLSTLRFAPLRATGLVLGARLPPAPGLALLAGATQTLSRDLRRPWVPVVALEPVELVLSTLLRLPAAASLAASFASLADAAAASLAASLACSLASRASFAAAIKAADTALDWC